MTRRWALLGLPLLVGAALLIGFASWKQRRTDDYLSQPARIHFPKPGAWTAQHPTPPPAPTGDAAVGSPGRAHASFVDVAAQAGLHYRWTIPGPRPLDILQTIGNGCAFLDYNNDGNLDILLVGPHLALYRGDGHGHFTDVTHQMGLDRFSGHFLGCAVGDYDNDGYDDIYISGYRTGLLLHNDKGKKFTDVTQAAGLKPQPWGTSCAWGDIDGDGKLDLYIGNYVQFDPKTNQRLCEDNGQQRACSPNIYAAEPNALYHNEGGGRFREVSASWNAKPLVGKTLGVAFADFDDSGRSSLYLSNDEEPGDLLQNKGRTFDNIGRKSGTAYDGTNHIHAGMGADWGDFDNDGRLDLSVTAFRTEPQSLFHNLGNGLFQDISASLALASRTLPYVAFGVKWLDYDNDGWLDLMITNGHVYDNADGLKQDGSYRQPTQLFHNDHARLFVDMSAAAGPALQRPIVGRGLAVGDYDNDGRIDALIVDSEGAPLLLHNESAPVGHWLTVSLQGSKSNRDGYGAVVTVQTQGRTLTRVCHSDGSYLSASDKRVHFGLGSANAANRLQIQWPDGHVDVFHNVFADHFVTIREGSTRLRHGPPPA